MRTADGGLAAVRCVVLTPCAAGQALLVTLPGTSRLELTPWHPVLCAASGRFRFPAILGGEVRLRANPSPSPSPSPSPKPCLTPTLTQA